MLETISSSGVRRQPCPYHQHACRVHDGIEWLILVESRANPQRAIETLGDVLDRHFVGERPIAAGVDHRDLVTALLENSLPHLEGSTLVRVAVDEHDRIARHWR